MRWIIDITSSKARILAVTYIRRIILFLTRLLLILFTLLLRLNHIIWIEIVFNQVAIDKVCIGCLILFKETLTLII